jgi:hypothetical protein
MGRILRRLRQLSFRSLDRGDHPAGSVRPVDNTDAGAASFAAHPKSGASGESGFPPGYVKPDDGRPRH